MSDQHAWAEYQEHFRTNVLPYIRESDNSVTIYSGDGTDFDVKQATELGALLLLGKPIVLVAVPGAKIPPGLERAADAIVPEWEIGKEGELERLQAALQRVTGDTIDAQQS